jgi:hypothetical protein
LIKTYDIDHWSLVRTALVQSKILIGSGAGSLPQSLGTGADRGAVGSQKPLYEMEFKNILFASDFGRSAEREAEYAVSLAQKHCSKLGFVRIASSGSMAEHQQ